MLPPPTWTTPAEFDALLLPEPATDVGAETAVLAAVLVAGRLTLTDGSTDVLPTCTAPMEPDALLSASAVPTSASASAASNAIRPKTFDRIMCLLLSEDATPNRQDLNVELAQIAVSSGVRWFSIGSDAHSALELEFLPFGMAIASLAGVPRERVINYLSADDVVAWARRLTETR